jgi:hypothetical protein
MADHKGTAFPIPKSLGPWDDKIAKHATVVEMKKAKAIHKACSEDYNILKMAEDGCKNLICAVVDEVYINELKVTKPSCRGLSPSIMIEDDLKELSI